MLRTALAGAWGCHVGHDVADEAVAQDECRRK